MFENIPHSIAHALVKLDRVVTGMPGHVTFDRNLRAEEAHGSISVRASHFGGKSIVIPFKAENASGIRKNRPYVQEEVIRQARAQGFEPIYLRINGPTSFERSIDPLFAL